MTTVRPSHPASPPRLSPSLRTRSQLPRSKKNVRFLPHVSLCAATCSTESSFESELWYTETDYSNFKAEAKRESRYLLKLESGDNAAEYARVMKLVMKACAKAASTGLKKPEEVSVQLEGDLEKCLLDAPDLVGLHKFCVGYLVQDASVRRTEMVNAVRETQSIPFAKNRQRQVIASTCQRISLPCSMFAQVIGRVAAKAA